MKMSKAFTLAIGTLLIGAFIMFTNHAYGSSLIILRATPQTTNAGISKCMPFPFTPESLQATAIEAGQRCSVPEIIDGQPGFICRDTRHLFLYRFFPTQEACLLFRNTLINDEAFTNAD